MITHTRLLLAGLPLVLLLLVSATAEQRSPSAPDRSVAPPQASAALPQPAAGLERAAPTSTPEPVVQATGREAPLRDEAAEADRAAQRDQQRIADNIAHLQAAAEDARAQGNPQRAVLMEKRIEGLRRRQRAAAAGAAG